MIRVGVAYTIMHPGGDRERVEAAFEVDTSYRPDVTDDLATRARTVLRDTMHDTWPEEVPAPPPDRK